MNGSQQCCMWRDEQIFVISNNRYGELHAGLEKKELFFRTIKKIFVFKSPKKIRLKHVILVKK